MGMSADELMEIKENDPAKATDIFENANCKTLIFRCRAKMDSFQDQARVRHQVMSASPINYKQEANKLAELIKLYNMD